MLFWGSIFTIGGVLAFFRRYYSVEIGNRIGFRMRKQIWNNLLEKDLIYFHSKETHSSLITHKMANDVTRVTNTLTNDISQFIRGFINMFGAGAILIYSVPETTVMSGILFASMLLITSKTGTKVKKLRLEETEKLGETSVFVSEKLAAIKLIKISNSDNYEKAFYDRKLSELYFKIKELGLAESIHFGVLNGYGQVVLLGIMMYSGFLVSCGLASSDMLAAAIYNIYFGIGAHATFSSYIELTKTAAIFKTLKPYLGTKLIDDGPLPSDFFTKDKIQKHFTRIGLMNQMNDDIEFVEPIFQVTELDPPTIRFQNVSFKYKFEEKEIFTQKSFSFPKSKVTAIIGSSGSGKSTILNLICKLFKINDGEIFIEDLNLNETEVSWVQRNISYVTQDMIMFSGSIYDNVVYGNQGFDISEDNVLKVLKQVGAIDFVDSLPNGVHSLLQENAKNLSGGQKQRLILARALLKNPKIIIMDEPTSALDKETEANIISELGILCKGRTVLIVTHKLQPFLHMVDGILDLDEVDWKIKNIKEI